jgi:hypothetical protein
LARDGENKSEEKRPEFHVRSFNRRAGR